MTSNYENQVNLLLDVLPYTVKTTTTKTAPFALKGGTAINLFYRDMPRLSVDIDLCYLPIEGRTTSFNGIHKELQTIKEELEKIGLNARPSKSLDGKSEAKLFVSNGQAEIKIEPNFTLRGCLFKPEIKTTRKPVISRFNKEVTVTCLNFADLFAGKICAALDRQHPRDLFDIKYFLENEGLTDATRKAFIVYLISHSRPINEVLSPNLKDLSSSFNNEFQGMTTVDVSLDELIKVRELLIKTIREDLLAEEKNFLLSLKDLNPKWELLGLERAKDLPAVKWKLLNLKKMSKEKRHSQRQQLEEKLFN